MKLISPKIGFVAVIALVAFLAGWTSYQALPGRRGIDQAVAQEEDELNFTEGGVDFNGFPLVWLGDEFEGQILPIDGVIAVSSPGNGRHPPYQRVDFLYGDCVVPDNERSCPIPLQVSVYPWCGPELSPRVVGEKVDLPGAIEALRYTQGGGHLYIRTEGYIAIIISSASDMEAQIVRAADALRGANNLAALTGEEQRNGTRACRDGTPVAGP